MVETVGFVLSVIGGLLILVFLVVIHELGHGIVARRNGVVVEEFGVGFPPLAWGKKIARSILGKNVLYSVNWLPIGGFVKLRGEYDAANKKGDYGAATFWQKTKIILAGVAMNWLFAAVVFTVLAFFGMPKLIENQFSIASDTVTTSHPLVIASVTKNSPAAKAGLAVNDIVKSINEQPGLADAVKAPKLTKEMAGKYITIEYQRGNASPTAVNVLLNTPENAQDGYLGVGFKQDPTTIKNTWSAPLTGVVTTAQLSGEIIKGLGDLLGKVWTGIAGNITGNKADSAQLAAAGDSVAGPVGIVGNILPSAVHAGLVPVLLISAILSTTLAVMNVLPIPALDGGRWYLMALFKLLRKPLTRDIEEQINSYGMMFLLALIALITVADVTKFIF